MNKMSLISLLATMLLAITVSTAAQAMSREEAEAQCRAYAKEDSVSAEEMQAYMQDCIENLLAADEEKGGASKE